jgi:hypothetical protein
MGVDAMKRFSSLGIDASKFSDLTSFGAGGVGEDPKATLARMGAFGSLSLSGSVISIFSTAGIDHMGRGSLGGSIPGLSAMGLGTAEALTEAMAASHARAARMAGVDPSLSPEQVTDALLRRAREARMEVVRYRRLLQAFPAWVRSVIRHLPGWMSWQQMWSYARALINAWQDMFGGRWRVWSFVLVQVVQPFDFAKSHPPPLSDLLFTRLQGRRAPPVGLGMNAVSFIPARAILVCET